MMIRKWFKVRTGDITIIQFLIEGYDGMATVSTIDPKTAVIQVLIMPDFADDAARLLQYLKECFHMEEMPSNGSQVLLC